MPPIDASSMLRPVASETMICPPWATPISRAHRLSTGPK